MLKHKKNFIPFIIVVFSFFPIMLLNQKNEPNIPTCSLVDSNPVAKSSIFEWLQKPAAIRFVGQYDRTYIAWITSDGKIQIRYYDNKEDKFSDTYTVDDLYKDYGIEARDDHNSPSLIILPNGKILIFYVVHDANNAFFMKQSENVEDITFWSNRQNITDKNTKIPYNYPQVKRLVNGNLLLFYRRGNYYDSDEYFKISTDNGNTWKNPTQLIDFGSDGVYAFIYSKGNQIAVAWNKSVSGDPPKQNVYYMYSSNGGKTWKEKNGSDVTLPLVANTADMVFNSGNNPAFVWDIVLDDNFNPVIVFAYKNDPNHEFRFAQWSKLGWITNTITTSAQLYGNGNFYSGGIVIDPQNVYSVYLSKQREQLEIEHWVSSDKGKTWQKADEVTKDSAVDNFRPQLVQNYSSTSTSSLYLIWASGQYEGLIDRQWTGFSKVNIQSSITKDSIPKNNCP